MTKKNQNRVWFLFVMGMLGFGISMVIWTIKETSSLPVQESNDYMLKYQTADKNINEIMALESKFNAKYKIKIIGTELLKLEGNLQNIHSKRRQSIPIKLNTGSNSFNYLITQDDKPVENAKVTFLLTRPHSRKNDHLEKNVHYKDGHYVTKAIELTKKGRYTLQLKVEIEGLIGYSEIPAYLTK